MCIQAHTAVHVHICMHVHTLHTTAAYIHMHVHLHRRVQPYVAAHVCAHICTASELHAHIHAHTQPFMHTHAHMATCCGLCPWWQLGRCCFLYPSHVQSQCSDGDGWGEELTQVVSPL